MDAAPGSGVVTNLANGYRTVWTIPSWIITQDVTINGTTLSNTNVQQTVTVTNTSAASRQYGLRFMWDWEIAGNDASFFRTRNPDGAFTSTFTTFPSPAFQLFEEVNNIATPLFSVFGTVTGGPLIPAPTTPDQLRYSSWGAAVSSAWDFTNTGGGSDSATEHYWGFNAPLTVAAGASATYTQYLTTNFAAGGGGQPLVQLWSRHCRNGACCYSSHCWAGSPSGASGESCAERMCLDKPRRERGLFFVAGRLTA